VPQLRELDLELALGTARAPRKDVEDEAGAVQHALADQLLEVALLGRRELVVHEHEIGGLGLARDRGFPRLAAADEIPRLGRLAVARDRRDRNRAGRACQRAEFPEFLGVRRLAEPMRTRIARSPRSGRSNKGSCRHSGQAVSETGASSSAPSAVGSGRSAPAPPSRWRACRPSGSPSS
jgi:hypothetical protein